MTMSYIFSVQRCIIEEVLDFQSCAIVAFAAPSSRNMRILIKRSIVAFSHRLRSLISAFSGILTEVIFSIRARAAVQKTAPKRVTMSLL